MRNDIYLRAHTVPPAKVRRQRGGPGTGSVERWPRAALVFDTETTTDTSQSLTFGAFRCCLLVGNEYRCIEEGLFYGDDAPAHDREVLREYVRREHADLGMTAFPPKFRLSLLSRSEFIERHVWRTIQSGGLIVGFNLPFDLSRLAVQWSTSHNRGWSLALSLRKSRKTGAMEPNPHRPRVRITAKDSHSAFISLAMPHDPEEWPKEARFLDLHTLAFALFNESCSLDRLCREILEIPGKVEHEPTGRVSDAEIDYCRGDVRATVDALNGLKREFDRHPLSVRPDRVYSPASLAKAYLDAMGIVPPRAKFTVPDEMLGVAMQAYYGGRAECRVRRVEVPVVHTDFMSQYPTVNALLNNWQLLTAKRVSFGDATNDVRSLLESITLDDLFRPEVWTELSFFALVRPDDDVLPVRAVYNGETQNIGINRLTSEEPIWFAGPDVVAAKLLSGKPPAVLRAVRIVPHGKQTGLKATSLRGMVEIDPRRHDFFRHVVEQRQHHKTSDEPLANFLKTLANSGSYGLFVEVTPEAQSKPVSVRVHSGNTSFDTPPLPVVERPGRWYFPPIAALITAGGRLLLAMLERCVRDAGGTHLFCDTDSLCIVASKSPKPVAYRCGEAGGMVPVLSRTQVSEMSARFASLNPYERTIVAQSILKIEKVNDDAKGRPRALVGFAISAKRYALYERTGGRVRIVDPKAHGLGYLFPPDDSRNDQGQQSWTWEAWEWIIRQELNLKGNPPKWLHLPAMMRVVLSTPFVLNRLNRGTRPYNFLLCPLVDATVGFPQGVDRERCTFIAAFTKDRNAWLTLACINAADGRRYELALEQDIKQSKVVPQTYGYVLHFYPYREESKSLAPDGSGCDARTRGVLQRASIVAGQQWYVGKETDRRWEFGEDLALLRASKAMVYRRGMAVPPVALQKKVAAAGRRALMRQTGLSQHTLEAVCSGRRVRPSTLHRLLIVLD